MGLLIWDILSKIWKVDLYLPIWDVSKKTISSKIWKSAPGLPSEIFRARFEKWTCCSLSRWVLSCRDQSDCFHPRKRFPDPEKAFVNPSPPYSYSLENLVAESATARVHIITILTLLAGWRGSARGRGGGGGDEQKAEEEEKGGEQDGGGGGEHLAGNGQSTHSDWGEKWLLSRRQLWRVWVDANSGS